MASDMIIKDWDGEDITEGDIIVTIVNTGQFVLVENGKTKTPEGKLTRVSKKVPNGIFELLAHATGRQVLKKADLLGVFPHNDSRNILGSVKGGITKDQINELISSIQTAGGKGTLLKVVVMDKIHPGMASVYLIKALETKEDDLVKA